MAGPVGFDENWTQAQRDTWAAEGARAYAEKQKGVISEAFKLSKPAARADGRSDAPPSASWPTPKPIESSLPRVAPLDPDLLPEAIRDYVLDVADRQQSPPDFAAIAALCGLASIVGNAARVRPKQHDDWEVVPNLWGAIVGRPSAMKSPAMRSALAPVFALQDDLRKEWEAAQREADINAALSDLDAGEARKKAAKAIKAGNREEAKRLMAEHSKGDEEETPCPRLIVNDATVEKLGELLNENPRGLLLIRDELPGFLARMESEEFQSERAFYLESFNGDGQFTYDRIGRGTILIENCTLSMIGGVQPARIAPLVKGAMTGERDDGLVQRLQLVTWPDHISSWTWTDRIPSARARERYDQAFRDLHQFAQGLDEKAIFGFAPKAQDMFRQWMTEIQTEARSGKLASALESHLLKMPKTVASLALIFHLVDGGRDAIGAEATGRALDFADYLRSHANRLYSAGAVAAENGAKLIVERRAQLPEAFTARDVWKKSWAGLYDRDSADSAIDLLISAGYCREAPPVASPSGGRPTVSYIWNSQLKVEG
ncbi:YfjI family protein [Methylosinus sp. Ce-a6]|uniref:YfjI family protein n=1 Tax=Methylosinus sp. Ce-a6 TaxID=2172005 RepID=UPI00191682D5|nr:YfjI family protein [Methylosinus sp. Ce-a6]